MYIALAINDGFKTKQEKKPTHSQNIVHTHTHTHKLIIWFNLSLLSSGVVASRLADAETPDGQPWRVLILEAIF